MSCTIKKPVTKLVPGELYHGNDCAKPVMYIAYLNHKAEIEGMRYSLGWQFLPIGWGLGGRAIHHAKQKGKASMLSRIHHPD